MVVGAKFFAAFAAEMGSTDDTALAALAATRGLERGRARPAAGTAAERGEQRKASVSRFRHRGHQ